jgi:hypothetical protein
MPPVGLLISLYVCREVDEKRRDETEIETGKLESSSICSFFLQQGGEERIAGVSRITINGSHGRVRGSVP